MEFCKFNVQPGGGKLKAEISGLKVEQPVTFREVPGEGIF